MNTLNIYLSGKGWNNRCREINQFKCTLYALRGNRKKSVKP